MARAVLSVTFKETPLAAVDFTKYDLSASFFIYGLIISCIDI